jgi:hypothetical protein
MIIDFIWNAVSPAHQNDLPQGASGNPQSVFCTAVKTKHFGGGPVPSSHSCIFKPFWVGERQGFNKCISDDRWDVLEPQVFGYGNFQSFRTRMKIGIKIMIMINIPGMERYGAYQGAPALRFFLTSDKNQLPRIMAAIRIGMTFRKESNVSMGNPSVDM